MLSNGRSRRRIDSKSPCIRRAYLSARVESRPVSERTIGSALGAAWDVTALWKSAGVALTRSAESVNSIGVHLPFNWRGEIPHHSGAGGQRTCRLRRDRKRCAMCGTNGQQRYAASRETKVSFATPKLGGVANRLPDERDQTLRSGLVRRIRVREKLEHDLLFPRDA